jgi:hypothetical protein
MIDTELNKDDHSSILAAIIWRSLKHLIPELILEIDYTGGQRKKNVLKDKNIQP